MRWELGLLFICTYTQVSSEHMYILLEVYSSINFIRVILVGGES